MEEINDRLAGLSPEKRRLLETMLRQKKVAAAAATAIPRRDQLPADQAAGPVPLSFAQERLWLTAQLSPESAAYNIPVPLHFLGRLAVAALRESLAHLVLRHESLRTRFEEREGVPVQVIDPPGGFSLPLVDLTALPEEEREPESLRLTGEEVRRPFDLLRGPVFRALLIRLSPTSHVLLSNMHHIVSDGWSTGIFGRETTLLYQVVAAGRPAASALPPLPIQYADFALWQRRTVSGPALEKQLDFWRRHLAGLDPVLELPTDRPRPVRRTDRGGNHMAILPPDVTQRLQELSGRERTTIFSTLLAGFCAFLHRQTGREDLCVGTPVAGRRKVETEGLIGFFVNTLVARSTLAGRPGNTPFRQHLTRLHEAVVDAQDNQDLPFDRLVLELAPERSPSHSPIFQVLFSLQSAPARDVELPAGLAVRPVAGSTRTTKFDLTLGVTESGGELWLNLEHSVDLFDDSTTARMIEQLAALLTGVAAAPESAVPDLPLLSAAELHQVLTEWGTGAAEPPSGACLHELFAAQVARAPDAVALVHGSERSTYAELAARAGGLAHCLRAAGVGPETRVAVCLERSPDLIASLLGILTAGGAYVPIDPAYPAERRALMLEDSGAAVLITRGSLSADLPATGAQTLDLDRESVFARREGGLLSQSGATPGNLAYLIYTSGSTGRPKGVAIEHRSAVALVFWGRELFPAEELAGVLAATSVCFDLSVFEIFVPLSWGGRLILAENALELPSLPARDEVRLLNTVPSAAAELVRGGGLPATVRTVNLAGEPLPGALAAALYAIGTVERVLNLYGPSEDTTYSTGSRVSRRGDRPPAIGRPLPGTRAFVVDRAARPVPAGVAGELWLAGAGLARGYLGRPELTAERFTPNPFSGLSGSGGERVYRTGDLVRFRSDGELEFLGRIDHQVKVRGFRIELGEIEEALRAHPAVEDCVCTVRDSSLVAYLVGAPDPAELRDWLGRRLPVYMVPSAFVLLPALPRTPNGKLDRKALPAPERRQQAAGELVAPRTRTEEILAEVWKELLGLDQVGVEDSFFALGGHSLLGTQALARVRQAFGVDLPLRELFEHPTVAALAELVDRRAGLEPGTDGAALEQPIPPRDPGTADFPLSFAQERLWLTWQLAPGSAAYNIPVPLRFTGVLDRTALGESLAHVVFRHESLRTRFEERDGVPVQVIDPPGGFSLPLADLTGLPAGLREAEGVRLTLEEIRRPFDLLRGPVLRSLLVRLTPDDHLLLSCMHHIVSDGWSTGVFGRETTLLYSALAAGGPADRVLPPLPIQYADFALWQRRALAGPALEKQIGFWRRQLAGLDPVLELPADRSRSARRTDRGDERSLSLPPAVSLALRELSGRERVTLFASLLAGFCAFLHRQTGSADLCVGTPIAGRRKVETEGLIGFFVNTLVVRSTLDGEVSFREHAARIHETFLDAQDHQDVPFDRLVLELEPERSPSHTPVFQVLFNLLSAPARAQELPAGLTIRPIEGSTRTAKFDLTLGVTDLGEALWLNLVHSLDLFDDSTATRLLGQLAAFFAGLAADPESPLSEIPLLSRSERHQILTLWGSGGDAPSSEACLHELFAAQVERTPEAVALVHGEERLTYAELAGRAGRLAHWLREAGVGPETRVAVCLERSPDLIASLLGILAAGGAYVPIDPAYPAERRALMLEDSGAAVVITRGSLAADLPATGAHRLDLDSERIPASGGVPSVPVLPENLAYLIYTSGSTGRPKAVAIEHRSAVALAFWARELFPPEELDGVLAATSVCFDLSVFEIFAPLVWGGRLILAENALELPSLPARDEVRLLNTVPSAAAELVRSGGLPASVRTVNLAGEPLPNALAAALYATGTVERVLNLYGPSEDTTYSTGALVPPASDRPPAIGRPLPGTRAFVVDRFGQPVPARGPGELWLAGAGLARGYLGRPDLTAERFTPHPFGDLSGSGGERVYRTGDLVRFRPPFGPDTELEFLGRIDHQVKVRGFRIELGEVEAALRAHPHIEDCVCVVRDAVLVAYVVGSPDLTGLRDHLSRRLPAYMVPSAFVPLPALPRTPNGKLDHKALPAPDRAARPAGEVVAPRTRTEQVVAGIWSELLGVGQVGADDGFFALGGHSLLGTQVLARVRQIFGVDLPLRDLFEHPTVAGLAARIDRQGDGGAAPAALASVPRAEARTDTFPLSFAQERLWLVDRLNPGSPAYNMPVALRFTGRLDVAALRESLSAVVRRHESLRTRFEVRDSQPAQVIDPPGGFRLPLVELSALPPEAREAEGARLTAAEMLRPFDLERGPVVRSTLVRLAGDRHLLLSTMHHIVSDGWSLGVFARELSLLYAALSSGRPALLPPLPIQYGDFAVWQRRTLAGPVLEKQIDYWRHQLAGLDPVLDLPADRPRPPVRSERGDSRSFTVAPPVLQTLEELRAREGTTLFTTLLAAFFALLSRVTGRDDLCAGTPVAGRRQIETEGLIGFFVNTLVPRADLAGNPPFREHLARLHRTFLDAQENQDVPFDRLVLELAPDRSLSYTPIFQVSFTLQNAPARPLVLPGLTVGAVEGSTRTSKFDLTLTMQAHGGDLFGTLTYAADLFDGTTIERLAGHFDRLVTAAAAHPGTPVRDLPLLAPAEAEQLLIRWNDTAAPVRTDRLLHELIASWAAETPDSLAVELPGTETLTFAELSRRAGRLARRLLAVGAGPETRVALCMERHPDLIVGVLAALEAGAAFVVIDPAQPTARLALVLRDAAPAAVLTREPAASRLPELEIPILRLDREAASGAPDIRLGRPVDLDHPAYVIYTSGSTGVPKGVVIRHGAVLNLLAALEEAIYKGSGPGLRVSVNAPLYFDGAIKQVVQLAQGRTLCLVPEEARPDPVALSRFLAEQRVDVLDCTPAQLEALVAHGWTSDGRPVPGRVLVGGEALSPALWDLLGQIRETRFFNVYGPSECTVDTTVREIGPDAPRPVLGRPITNVRTYVMADLLTPQPVGVPGELCVGGAGLARGYLGRPELTAERFVPNPFAAEPGARLYRTGDLARWLPEGELEFLGRIDHQVKVRGFRIEPGEIEAALRQHPAVGACVVLARDDERGNRMLVAYVTGSPEAGPDPAALRAFLGERLPAYMVPAAFVVLDALPLTRNGKVDRKALPAPGRTATGAQPGEPGPRDLLELELVRLWEEALRVQPVGIRDDFFALGGHSLLAVQLTSRLRERLGREVPLAALLSHPTVERLASVLRRAEDRGETAFHRVPLVELAAGDGRPLFLVHPIGGEVVAYVPLARHLARLTGRPVHGLQVPDRAEPWRTIEEMAAGYLRSVRELQPEGPYTLGGWSMGGVVAFEMARQLDTAGEVVDAVVLIDSFAPTLRREPAGGGALVASFAFDLAGALRIDLTGIGLPPDLLELGTGEALERLAGLAEQAGLLPPGLDAAELARRFAVFATGHRALERYAPGSGRAPLLLFRATERPAGMPPPPADLGWGPLAAEIPVAVHEQPGDHYTLLRESAVEGLAAKLRAHLEHAEQTRLPLEISSVESPSMKGSS